MMTKNIRIPLPMAAYETARAEAARNNVTCVGTQIRRDIVAHYERVAAQAAKREKKAGKMAANRTEVLREILELANENE